MRLPIITGTIDRRILVNYRVDPEIIEPLLPPPFRPKVVQGHALAGICLIRLRGVRPRWAPAWMGLPSENAAHRVAVEWDTPAGVREGVFVRRRDTDSRLNALAGGRLFPGIHHHARFTVRESADHFEVALRSDDGDTSLSVVADLAGTWPTTSLFASLDEASEFFAAGSLGYSPTSDPRRLQGLELACRNWHVEPLTVASVRSSLFDDHALFPPGSAEFDCALLMRGIEHEWHGREDLCCQSAAPSESCATKERVSPIAAA
jgi:uncharacterized protein YqjF (DUF2071 family)